MVVLNVKKGEQPQFLFETTVTALVEDVTNDVADIYNTRLRIDRLCMAIEQLAQFGIMKTPKMQGLTPDQVVDLKLKDETDKFYPSGGSQDCVDDIGLRTGKAPNEQMRDILTRTIEEAKAAIHKDLVKRNVKLTMELLHDVIEKLRGAVMIVYPMGLPPYDEVQIILDDDEDLSGRQAEKEVVPPDVACLWWANKELTRAKKLSDFVGKNEKTKITCKIQKKGLGAPSREPLYDEETQKTMMSYAYKKQEEWKKISESNEDEYMNSSWADGKALRNQLQGTMNIQFK
eukprot:m.111924 g.111924  ORF g.111924 m.111924 type:complete len:288 (-) comp9243_c2_seq6:4407-5270(-)